MDWNTFKSGKKIHEILAESKRRVEVDLPAQGGHNLLPVVPGGSRTTTSHQRRTYTVKKGLPFSRPQPGYH
jgi:hypothetical protein